MAFQRINLETEAGKALMASAVESANRTNYNLVGREYNATKLNEALVFPWERDKVSTLTAQLQVRGLTRDSNYTVNFVSIEGVENVVLTRLNEVEATVLVPGKRAPRKAKEAAPAAPATDTPAASAAPATDTPAASEGKGGKKASK